MLTRLALPRIQQQPIRLVLRPQRFYSTTELSNGITLAYDLHEPPTKKSNDTQSPSPNNAPPIIFIHGLFGSKKNNRSMSKRLAQDLRRPVYALDMRNHGDSSHHPDHTYTDLATDTELFLRHHKLHNPTLIGHSMGAKTVMAVALRGRVPVANLIPIDNSPVDAALKSDFGKYVDGMRAIAAAKPARQSDADALLRPFEEALPIRQFLLTNLIRSTDNSHLTWRIPLKTLAAALPGLGDFPFKDPEEVRFEGPTLVVRGTKSRYVADEMLPVFGRFFPRFEVVDVEGGHWVVSENPEAFRRAVVEFLQEKE